MDEESSDVDDSSFGCFTGQSCAPCSRHGEAGTAGQEAEIGRWDRRRGLHLDPSPAAGTGRG